MLAVPALAGAQERAGLGEFAFSRDSDGLQASVFSVGAAPLYAAPYRYTGVLARSLRYSQADWAVDGGAIGVQERRRYKDGWLHLDAGVAKLDGTSVSAMVSRGWFDESGRSVELMLERGLVDSRQGIEKNLSATLVGVGGDLPLAAATILTGSAGIQYVEDDNWRTHVRLRLTHELVVAPTAVQLQARYRGIRADNPHTGNYFNPRSLDEVLFGAFARVDRANWRGILWAGAGSQRVDGTTKGAYAVEASLVSPRLAEMPAYLTLSFGVKHDGARGDGYTYRYVSAGFAARF
jgi:hypothetical protein